MALKAPIRASADLSEIGFHFIPSFKPWRSAGLVLKRKEITFKEENNVTTINPNNLNLKENILVDTPEESKWIYIDYFRSIEISKDDKIDNNLNCIDEISKNEIGEIVQINNDNKNDKVNLKENIIENNNGDNSI